LRKSFRNIINRVVIIRFLPDGKKMVLATNDCKVHLLDTATCKILYTTYNRAGPLSAVAISLDSKKLLSASDNRIIQLCNTEIGELSLSIITLAKIASKNGM